MLKIYFDDVLIDSDNYMSLKVNDKLFDKSFILGSVPSETLTLEVPSSFSIPEKVKIMQDDVNYGFYNVDKAEYKNDTTLKLTLIDNVILTEKPYDASTLFPNEGDSTTTKAIFEDICDKAGIEYDSSGFTINDDISVNYYDTSIKGRQYLSYLAELNGGYISQNNDGEICFNRYKWSYNLFPYSESLASKIEQNAQMTKTGTGRECTLTKTSEGTASPRIQFDNDFFKVDTTYYFSFKVKGNWNRVEFGTWINNQQTVLTNIVPTNEYQLVRGSFTYPSTKYTQDRVYWRNNAGNVSIGQSLLITDFMITNREELVYMPYVEGGTDKPQTLLNTEDCENFKLGEKHQIERVVYDNGKVKFAKARPSINILNFDDLTESANFVHTEDNTIITKNVWASSILTSQKVNEIFEPNTHYTIRFKAKVLVRPTTFSTANHNRVFLLYNGSTAVYVDCGQMDKMSDEEQTIVKEFTTPSSLENVSMLNYDFHGTDGTGSNRGIGEIELKEIMIVKGSYTEETFPRYEPYGDLSEDENLETLYLNPLNPYINDQETVDNIANQIIGFEYYNFSTKNCPIDMYAKAGDVLRITDGENEYSSIIQYELKYNGAWLGGYSLNLDSKIQQETVVVGESPEYKSLKVIIDREGNRITQVAADVTSQGSKISVLEQTDEGLSSLITSNADNISNLSDSLEENVETLQKAIQANTTLIQQTAESITSYITKSGGNNLIRNSVGYKNTEFWELSNGATVNTSQDTNTEQTTTSGSKFIITAGTMKADYTTIIDTNYTLSFKYKKSSAGTPDTASVRLHRSESDYVTVFESSEDKEDWVEITYPYKATTSTPYIVIDCGGDTFEISDLIINEGEKQVWSSYKDEIYGKTHKLDSTGLSLSSLETEENALLDNNSLIFRDSNGITSEVSKERVYSEKAVITSEIHNGEFIWRILDGDNMILF